VFVALLGGIGIGAFRPLGAYSELLLLIFAPWLFVGTGPLALAGYERARDMKQLNTFAGLIPPTWLSIPALVVFALLFRGLSQQWRAAGGGYQRLGGMVALPALPALGGVLLLVWLAGAQQLRLALADRHDKEPDTGRPLGGEPDDCAVFDSAAGHSLQRDRPGIPAAAASAVCARVRCARHLVPGTAGDPGWSRVAPGASAATAGAVTLSGHG
jgi:hypothetical protein